jgi:N-acetyl-gamma-glutamyl-phosphate reductase
MRRGMASTIAIPITEKIDISDERIGKILTDVYANQPFIGLRGGNIPSTRDVVGSNRCDIGWSVDNGVIYLFSVIDNLVKGASGQAVQDFNIRFGFPQTAGLPLRGEV